MKRAIALLVGLSLLNATANGPWPAAKQSAFGGECHRFAMEILKADFTVYVVRNAERNFVLDIGVKDKTFTTEELEHFFKSQRHKDFIVVGYDRDAKPARLKESQEQLKKFFRDAGYKRILLLPENEFHGIISEDYRPEPPPTKPAN